MREPDDEMSPALEALINAVWDIPPRLEQLHDRDCPACDVSDEVAGMIACYWDTDDNWDTTPVGDGLPGDTKLAQLSRLIAHVLHRRMPGHRRHAARRQGVADT